MATKASSKRLGKESQLMQKDAPPYCFARPREDNILEWHFILRGPPDTPYDGGEYWGQLIFPSDYPFKPPGIKMSTPSGRFATDQKLCTSMSDFHPGSWNPAWSVSNILVGLLSFMCADEMTTGGIRTSEADRVTLANRSHAFNISQLKFRKIFPEYSGEVPKELPNMGERKAVSKGNAASSTATKPPAAQADSKEISSPQQTTATAQSGADLNIPAQRNADTRAALATRPQQWARTVLLLSFAVLLLAISLYTLSAPRAKASTASTASTIQPHRAIPPTT